MAITSQSPTRSNQFSRSERKEGDVRYIPVEKRYTSINQINELKTRGYVQEGDKLVLKGTYSRDKKQGGKQEYYNAEEYQLDSSGKVITQYVKRGYYDSVQVVKQIDYSNGQKVREINNKWGNTGKILSFTINDYEAGTTRTLSKSEAGKIKDKTIQTQTGKTISKSITRPEVKVEQDYWQTLKSTILRQGEDKMGKQLEGTTVYTTTRKELDRAKAEYKVYSEHKKEYDEAMKPVTYNYKGTTLSVPTYVFKEMKQQSYTVSPENFNKFDETPIVEPTPIKVSSTYPKVAAGTYGAYKPQTFFSEGTKEASEKERIISGDTKSKTESKLRLAEQKLVLKDIEQRQQELKYSSRPFLIKAEERFTLAKEKLYTKFNIKDESARFNALNKSSLVGLGMVASLGVTKGTIGVTRLITSPIQTARGFTDLALSPRKTLYAIGDATRNASLSDVVYTGGYIAGSYGTTRGMGRLVLKSVDLYRTRGLKEVKLPKATSEQFYSGGRSIKVDRVKPFEFSKPSTYIDRLKGKRAGQFKTVYSKEIVSPEVLKYYETGGMGGTTFPYDAPSTHLKYFTDVKSKFRLSYTPKELSSKGFGYHAAGSPLKSNIINAEYGQLFYSGKGVSLNFLRLQSGGETSSLRITFRPTVYAGYFDEVIPLKATKEVILPSGAKTYLFPRQTQAGSKLYLPLRKPEVEGVLQAGTELVPVDTRYFFKLGGRRVPITEQTFTAEIPPALNINQMAAPNYVSVLPSASPVYSSSFSGSAAALSLASSSKSYESFSPSKYSPSSSSSFSSPFSSSLSFSSFSSSSSVSFSFSSPSSSRSSSSSSFSSPSSYFVPSSSISGGGSSSSGGGSSKPPPFNPSQTPLPEVPFLKFKEDDENKKKKKSKIKPFYKYAPDLFSVVGGITAPKSLVKPSKQRTGLSIRPIIARVRI